MPEEKKEDSMNNAEKEIKTNTINKDNLNFYFKICQPQDFLKKECVPTNYNANMIKMIKQSINEGSMDDILEDVINESKIDISNSYDSIKYHITSSFNQKNKKYDDISVIDLAQCEQKLKEIYKIRPNETLIIFKYDYLIEGLLIPIIGYEVFHPITKEILDLSHCNNTKIDLIIPVNIDENKVYKHDPKDNYYEDKCNSYPNEKGVDMTLYDRKKEYNDKNLSLCADNCEFFKYDNETKKALCQCEPQFNSSLITLDKIINKKKLLNNFLDVKKTMNLEIVKCYNNYFI